MFIKPTHTHYRTVKRMYIYYVNDEEKETIIEVGSLLKRYDSFFIGRLPDHLLNNYKRSSTSLIDDDYLLYGLFIFTKNGEVIKPLDVVRTTVSRSHALILNTREIRICDHGKEGKGSTNGTYVNGVRVSSGHCVHLPDEAVIQLGNTFELTFFYDKLVINLYEGRILPKGTQTVRILRDMNVEYQEITLGEKLRDIPYIIIERIPEKLKGKRVTLPDGREFNMLSELGASDIQVFTSDFIDLLKDFITNPTYKKKANAVLCILRHIPENVISVINRSFGQRGMNLLGQLEDSLENCLSSDDYSCVEAQKVANEVYSMLEGLSEAWKKLQKLR